MHPVRVRTCARARASSGPVHVRAMLVQVDLKDRTAMEAVAEAKRQLLASNQQRRNRIFAGRYVAPTRAADYEVHAPRACSMYACTCASSDGEVHAPRACSMHMCIRRLRGACTPCM